LLYLKGHVFMSETASVAGQKSQESGIQSVPGTQGTTQAHTPGPWTLGPMNGGQVSVRASRTGLGGEHFAATLATVEIYDEDEPADEGQWHANARLIAAAPDLLEALRIAHDADSECDCPRDCYMAKAIAKAEGR
jgi:hypothetical protein